MERLSIHVAIIGAGLGGLAAATGITRAGHKVTVLEQSCQFQHVGAGIQIPPNSSRILHAWGLIPEIAKHSIKGSEFRFRAWKDGRVLHRLSMRHEDIYGEGKGMYQIHRADYHTVLADEARRLGVNIQLGATVTGIDFDNAVIDLLGGDVVKADVIIGADGLNSICRELLLGRKDPPHRTGDLAYRLTVKAADMRAHPILHELVDGRPSDIWFGPQTFVVAYLLKEDRYYNLALICPDTMGEDTNVAKATVQEMRDLLEGWDPRLQALLDLVESTQKWRLLTSGEMAEWCHPGGKFALMGDACHASLPYLAQGAAMAVEDAGVLSELFADLTNVSQIPEILKIYESLRKPRTTRVIQDSLESGKMYKLPNGEEQLDRDRKLAMPGLNEYPLHIASQEYKDFLYGYDAFAEADKARNIGST